MIEVSVAPRDMAKNSKIFKILSTVCIYPIFLLYSIAIL